MIYACEIIFKSACQDLVLMQQKWLRRSSVFGQAKNSLASSALRPGKTLKPQVVGRFAKTTVTSIFNENT